MADHLTTSAGLPRWLSGICSRFRFLDSRSMLGREPHHARQRSRLGWTGSDGIDPHSLWREFERPAARQAFEPPCWRRSGQTLWPKVLDTLIIAPFTATRCGIAARPAVLGQRHSPQKSPRSAQHLQITQRQEGASAGMVHQHDPGGPMCRLL